MRRAILALAIVSAIALPAAAGNCMDGDEEGWWNGTTEDAAGCVTQAEYEALYSAENLQEVGVIDSYTVHEDGTTTLVFRPGIEKTVASNPLDRPVAVNPELEPDAPSVRQVLWFPATATRLAALIG